MGTLWKRLVFFVFSNIDGGSHEGGGSSGILLTRSSACPAKGGVQWEEEGGVGGGRGKPASRSDETGSRGSAVTVGQARQTERRRRGTRTG